MWTHHMAPSLIIIFCSEHQAQERRSCTHIRPCHPPPCSSCWVSGHHVQHLHTQYVSGMASLIRRVTHRERKTCLLALHQAPIHRFVEAALKLAQNFIRKVQTHHVITRRLELRSTRSFVPQNDNVMRLIPIFGL
jgi:hypothetical protein